MQAKQRIVRIFLVLFVVSLLLGACGGGTTGKTWFNLPSIPIRVHEDGNASLYGFNIGPVLQPALLQQLQAANIQKLELRIGYNGIHLLVNGEDMPYIAWDQESTNTLQAVLSSLPTIPNGAQIAQALPWLRTFGLGAAIYVAPAAGTAALDIPPWTGETAVTPETVDEPTVGPITIGAVVFDAEGNATIEGIPLETLEQITGSTLPLRLDANTLALLQSLGMESIRIVTQPNGIDLFMNEQPLPGIAYDTAYLARTAELASLFITDPAQLARIDQVISILPGAQVTLAVSFNGEPIAETDLGTITLEVTADGTLVLAGIPVAANAVPADTVANFQEANVQQLDLDVNSGGLFAATNGEILPTITWTPESLALLTSAVAPMAGMPADAINEVLGTVLDTGIKVRVKLPPAEGAQPLEIPDEVDTTMAPPDLGEFAPPFLRVSATYNQTELQQLGTLDADELANYGIVLPANLPPDVAALLYAFGAEEVKAATGPGKLELLLDGTAALTVNYDVDALQRALNVAVPFMQDSPLSDPGVAKIVDEQVLPLVPGADFDMTITLQ